MPLSCTRTVGTGVPQKKDWSYKTISQRTHRKTPGQRLKNQLIFGEVYAKGYMFVSVTGIKTNPDDGKVYGRCHNKRVVRDGYAYGLGEIGQTPGRWLFF